MGMRITTQDFYNEFLTGLQQNLQAQYTDTSDISSGKTINSPSDDPSLLQEVVAYQTQLSDIGQYKSAVNAVNTPIKSLDSSLTDLSTTLNRANELAVSAGDGSIDSNSRLLISDEVQQLLSSSISTANTQVNGQYIFGGFHSNVNPIDPTTGEFASDSNSVNVGIASGVNVATNISAGSLFSFSRVNTTDSTNAIMPSYGWTNSGLNTIPDADPVSALETTVPSTPIYTINGINSVNHGDQISIGGTTYNLTGGPYSTPSALANQLNIDTAGSGVTFSYAGNKFTMTNTSGANVTIDWGSTTPEVDQTLGVPASGSQLIASGGHFSGNTVFPGDSITIGGTTYNLTGGSYSTPAKLAAQLNADTNGSGLTFSFDPTNNKFQIENTTGASVTINWGSTTLQAEQMLGFSSTGNQTISANQGTIESDNAVGNFTASDNVFTVNGGALDINVNKSTTPSSGAFVINGTNNAVSISGTTYYLKYGTYTGAGLATALSGFAAGMNVSYVAADHKFTIASSASDAIDLSNSTIKNIIGFNSAASQTLSSTGIMSDYEVGDVNLAAGSTLQDVRDAINAAGAGVNAQIANEGTAINPDFRLVVASDTAGDSSDIDISVLQPQSAADSAISSSPTVSGSLTGGLFSPDIINDFKGGTISFTDPISGDTYTTPAIAAGPYASMTALVAAMQTAFNNATDSNGNTFVNGGGNSYLTVTANSNSTFSISNSSGDNVNINWSSGTVSAQQLGFAPDSAGPPAAGVYQLSYDTTTGQNMTLGTKITNYNYITQASANDSIVIDDATKGGIANNQFVVQEAGYAAQTISIDRGTYTPDQLTADIAQKLNAVAAADGSGNNFSVTFDPNANKFQIKQTNAASLVAVNFQWDSSNTTAAQILGFNPATTTNANIAAGGGSVESDNSVLANYYNFNNNYLNDKYILRALNFENQSLTNNDTGRIGQSLQYLSDLTDTVSQKQAVIGARENEVSDESNVQLNNSTNTQIFLSNTEDTDLAQVASDLTTRQASLQALRSIMATVLGQTLFDFIKLS